MAQGIRTFDTQNLSQNESNSIAISTLRRRRGRIQGQITAFVRNMDQCSNSEQDIEALRVALESLSNYWAKLDEVQSELEALDVEQEPRRFEVQNTYFQAVGRARVMLRATERLNTPALAKDSQTPLSSYGSNVTTRLPEIRLPTFSGAYDEWNTFFDQFSSIIDRNEDLTPTQKLQYLRSTLTGRAATCIASLSTIDANYESALEILKNKYDCTRKVILKHCDVMRGYPKLAKDSPQALGELVDFFNQHLKALQNLKQPISSWSALLISIILSKINSNTIWHWHLTLKDKTLPSYTNLLNFLEQRAESAAVEPMDRVPILTRQTNHHDTGKRITKPTEKKQMFLTQVQQCPICTESHRIWMCNRFKTLSVEERTEAARKIPLCMNCLGQGHDTKNCRLSSCRVCQRRHHTLLHRTDSPINQTTASVIPTDSNRDARTRQSSYFIDVSTNDLLVTAQVDVINRDKNTVRGRVLIDTGSTTNFMTEGFAKSLGLPMGKCNVPVGTLNAFNTVSKHTIRATIKSRLEDYERILTFLTIPQISTSVPDQPIDRSTINIPHNVKLADPNFHCTREIDMLLGTGVSLSILCVGQINLTQSKDTDLFLQKTRLGWVIGGSTPTPHSKYSQACHITRGIPDISKFWEIEDGPQIKHRSQDEIACEDHFKQHIARDVKGRYTVALPFNAKKPQLGESHNQALKRFLSLEKRLSQNATMKQQYHEVIAEYLNLGHLSEIKEDNQHEGVYLPHHAVIKTTSLTTKLRVVFDGSAKTNTGVSLNDTLFIGPKLQDDLVCILIRFRIHRYVLTGDIEKMYRQFLVRPQDRKFQKILWRNLDDSIQTYCLNTITFGLSAAPYLAIRCLQQLAEDEAQRFPIASKILKRDFYVDDALTGCSTIEEAITLRQELKQILQAGGLNIRQWVSNEKRLLEDLNAVDINKQLQLGETSSLKTLGIIWHPETDSIHFTVKINKLPIHVTKRSICSEIAKIYDPLGLLAPIIVTAKLILQRIWTIKTDWDESLPTGIHTEWVQFYNKLPLLHNIAFPRHTMINQPTNIQLHGFCDASTPAYGACVYLRAVTKEGQISTHLLMAKSKVAPLKLQTIPRLELCGALLLTSLITTVKEALHIKIDQTVSWTDSTIVLHWLKTSPHLLKTFVANRVAEIQRNATNGQWKHVRTDDNPADLIFRGATPEEFMRAAYWEKGPIWLRQTESQWPVQNITITEQVPEQKKHTCCLVNTTSSDSYTKYSSWTRLQRIIAYCLRWRHKNTNGHPISVLELKQAETAILKQIQREHFAQEITCLTGGRDIHSSSKLLRLQPFLDKNNLLRVGGRLQNSEMSFSQKHQIILPKSHITKLIIQNQHHVLLHAGVRTTLYAVRQRYWPISGRSLIWETIRSCVRCCRYKPPPVNYIMGHLPEARVTESRPFTHVGVDYCGPFYIKERRHRNRTRVKAYVAVFICLAVKAVHLELVGDMTTEGFIGALRRFIGRRGFCTDIYSDNGSNFVGANNELKELKHLLEQDNHRERTHHFLSNKSISWHFSPPHSPHFGGLWEAAVRSFKYHFRRVAGATLFTFENLNTLIIEIESILNSRPLTPLSQDPTDLSVLTPGHFLIGDVLTSLRDRDFRDVPVGRLSCWQQIQQVKQHFWTRWQKEYLNEMTQRNKWNKGSHSIDKDSMVILMEDNTPPSQWALGRILQVHPGSDGIIRTATVKTSTSILTRSVKKLVALPIPTSKDEDIVSTT